MRLPTSPASGHRLVLLSVLVVYLVLHVWTYETREAPYYPRWFDQVDHRTNAAHVADAFRADGLGGFVEATVDHSTAQGFVHVALGGLTMAVGIDPVHGVFALFLLMLFVVWEVLGDRGRRPWVGWAGVALVLAPLSWQRQVGGMFDFRPDFLGQILWTTAFVLALGCRGFADRRRAIWLGVVLGCAFCSRSISLVYAVAALPFCVVAAWTGIPAGRTGSARRRLGNLGIATLVAGLLALPFYVGRFDVLWDYYVTNHISTAEIEARGATGGFVEHLEWYWRSLRVDHLGHVGYAVMALVALAGLANRHVRDLRPLWPGLLLVLGFGMPLVVLSLGPHYSNVVPGIVAGVLALACVLPLLAAGRRWLPPRAVLVVGVALALTMFPARRLWNTQLAEMQRIELGDPHVTRLLNALGDAVRRRGGRETTLSCMPLIDGVTVPMLQLHEFERTGAFLDGLRPGLGHTIYARESDADFLARLRAADLAVFWDGGNSADPNLPSNQEVARNADAIRRILETEFEPLPTAEGSVLVHGHPMRAYRRRDAGNAAGLPR